MIRYLFILSVLVFCMQCKNKKNDPTASVAKKNNFKADGFIVKAKQLEQNLTLPGSITALEEVALHPDVSGRVTAVYFKEGAYVKKGAPLLKIYDADLQAQLKKLVIQLKTAKKTVERNGMLLGIGGVSQQEYDLSELAVETIKADIFILKTNIAKTTMYAPFSGKIGLTTTTKGSYVTQQDIVATLKQTDALKISFAIPELYGALLQNGDIVQFTIEGGSKKYGARISASENNIDENTRSLSLMAQIINLDEQLIAGKFVNVTVALNKNNEAILVPTQSILPQARVKQVVMIKNGLANFKTVTTGYRDSSFIEITSGLQVGDTILTTGLLSVKQGNAVQMNPIINN